MPGDNVLGCCCRKSVICVCDGRIMFSRSLKASWNVIEPFIASLVRRATSSPLPQNLASSSMPSSWITVESTSKQTTLESRIICAAAAAFFDLSLPVVGWLAQRERGKRKTVERENGNGATQRRGDGAVVSLVKCLALWCDAIAMENERAHKLSGAACSRHGCKQTYPLLQRWPYRCRGRYGHF